MLRYGITDVPPVRPKKLRFGLMSAKEISNMSVCHVTETTLYYRGLPASGGLLDPLMGSVDRRHLCASCMRDAKLCQGHPGHINLSFPVYHIGFLETVVKTLRTVCFCCSRVCANSDDVASVQDLQGRARLSALHTALRLRRQCPHCNMHRPTYSRVPLGIRIEWAEDAQWESESEREYCTRTFTARDALSILQHMTDEDVSLLGFEPHDSHPMHMIVQNLVVPPPCTRPAIYSSEGSRSRGQNDLTVRFLEVLKRSQEVRNFLNSETWKSVTDVSPDLMDRINRLQYEVFMLVNNNARIQRPPGMGRSNGGAHTKSLTDRLKGKEGRVRGNLMGKRVDFSARCVITPDAYFDCDRVGVPYGIAMNLTIPETVNSINIRHLSERVKKGCRNVHGAQCIIGTDGMVTNLETCKMRDDIVLRPGDVVERFLSDDDTVVFNRQPSLHMHGMCAHRVRLMPGHTFRLSLVAASPYNADFDGDEMNLHVPQSKAAEAECATLMAISQNCIGAQTNKPVMGIVQDSLLGLHLLSQKDVFFDRPHLCRILGYTRYVDIGALPAPAFAAYVRGKETRRVWTGKQLFSCLLPKALYMEPDGFVGTADSKDSDLPVVIRAGQLLCGVLQKAHVGTAAGGVIDVITREFGGVQCVRFMGDAQRMTHAFLMQRGHHVGIDDVMLSSEGQEQVNERLTKASNLCEEIQREVVDAPEEVMQTAERAILRLLSKMLLQTGGVVNEHMSERNAIRRMVTAGSKGSFINLSQICASLGQQSLEGARIVAEKGNRTLPCFASNDLSLASRGMVYNSFALGLSPSELFYHAVGGREGLVDTAVKTSQTGYISRRMNKSMEDLCVHSDGTVRNSLEDIVSFRWGSDGLHPAHLERVKLGKILAEPVELAILARMTPAEAELACVCRQAVLRNKTHVLVSEMDARVLLPFHPTRVRHRIRRCYTEDETLRVDRDEAERRTLALARTVPRVVALALLDVACTSEVARMRSSDHSELMDSLTDKIDTARSTQSVSVGCIAAQSIGEPCTQMTLNTFHFAGCAAKNVTMGIPRLKELLDASKSPKTPCTTIRFREPYASSGEFAEYMANTLPLTRLGDVVAECDILHDPDLHKTVVAGDEWMVRAESILRSVASTDLVDHCSGYVIRMVLQQQTMQRRKLTPPMIRDLLQERLQGRALVCSSETNSVEWIVRIRCLHVASMVEMGSLVCDQEAILCHRTANVLLETVLISGHPDVSGANAAEATRFDTHPVQRQEHVVHVYGHFLVDCASSHCVDWTRSTSNDVWEVYHTLGIEACAHVLFDQLNGVVSFDGTYVDYRHLMMIVDTICRGGSLMPLNRHGINRAVSNPLMRASFEETTDVLCDAAIFAESENAKGVTTSIMMGQLANFGSGNVQVFAPSGGNAPQSLQVSKRVLWSKCRSHASRGVDEVMEYVIDDVRPVPTRPLSPPVLSSTQRKRARFRPRSPVFD